MPIYQKKICKDGRIWGQNNKEAGTHLGILQTGKPARKLTDEENKNRWRNYGKDTRFQKGYKPLNGFKKGHKRTKGSGRLYLTGEKHHSWKGGITPEDQKRVHSLEWIKIRNKIYERDNWHCKVCGKHCQKDIQCHHIIPYRITRDNSERNLITLCRRCHKKEERRYYNSLKEV